MTSTWLSRQPSHTGGPTAAAALLARADTVANLARVHESPVPLPEYFFHEERLIWRRHDPVSGRQDPILGDVRGAVMSQLRLQRLHDWARAGTQGVLIRRALQAHPDIARTLLDACRGFRSLRSDEALQYAALALASWLPTEHRLAAMQNHRARAATLPLEAGGDQELCRLCRDEDETMSHILHCRVLAPDRAAVRHHILRMVMDCAGAGARSPRTHHRFRTIMLVMSPSRSEDDLRAFEVLYPLAPDLPSSGSLHRDLNYTHCHYQTVKARYGYFLSLPHCVRIG